MNANAIVYPKVMIDTALRKIEKRLRVNEGVSEGEARALFDRILGPLVDDLVEYIFAACDQDGVVKRSTPLRHTSQQGNAMLSVARPDDDDRGNDTSPLMAAEFTTYGILRKQCGVDGFRKDVRIDTSRKMVNADAMAMKASATASLHLTTADLRCPSPHEDALADALDVSTSSRLWRLCCWLALHILPVR